MKTGRIARSACAVLAIGLSVGGCGIQLRAHHPATVPPALADPYVTPDGTPVPPPASTQPLVLAPRQTVVTITFDDGWASAAIAAQILTTHNLPATFFVNSGTIGKPGHLSLADLKSMAASGNEIAGHTLTHPDLAQLPDDEARRQICDDRTTLLGCAHSLCAG